MIEYVRNHIHRNNRTFFFTKKKDYRDEAEFRIVFHSPDKQYEYLPIEDSLVGIVLGEGFPPVYRSLMERFSGDLNFKLHEIRWNRRFPQLFDVR